LGGDRPTALLSWQTTIRLAEGADRVRLPPREWPGLRRDSSGGLRRWLARYEFGRRLPRPPTESDGSSAGGEGGREGRLDPFESREPNAWPPCEANRKRKPTRDYSRLLGLSPLSGRYDQCGTSPLAHPGRGHSIHIVLGRGQSQAAGASLRCRSTSSPRGRIQPLSPEAEQREQFGECD
jgi:hypothetical protein